MKAPIYIYLSKDKRTTYKSAFKIRAYPVRNSVGTDEIELKLNLDIPDTIFDQPDLEANIEVDAAPSAVPSIKIKANAVSEWLKK